MTRTVDPFGNQVDYIYRPGTTGECRLAAVTWGQNVNAGVGYFAAVELHYASSPAMCPSPYGIPVGSQASYRTGTRIVTGYSQLDSIEIAAFAPVATSAVTDEPIPASTEHTREITLTYDTTCGGKAAPYRALKTIQESAVGIDSPQVTLPPVEFTYGNASLTWPQDPVPSATAPWAPEGLNPLQNARYNLGWGYRFPDGGGWPTVEAMMVDIDGDGLLDRLTNSPLRDGGVRFCRASWERNLGPNIGFGQPAYIDIPTLKWASPSSTPYQGGHHARENQVEGANELCALNYQRTGYVNTRPGGGSCAGATCPGIHCANGTDCSPHKFGNTTNTVFAWRWMDIDGDALPDLIGSPIQGGLSSYDLQQGAGIVTDPLGSAPAEPAIFTTYAHPTFPACPTPSFSAYPADPGKPYTMCGGMFPWFVYKNHGNGVFGQPRNRPPVIGGSHDTWGPAPDQILYQPVPLETSSGDSSVWSFPVGEDQGTVDIDGDGFADAVYRLPQSSLPTWYVFRNDGTGQLVPNLSSSQFVWDFPSAAHYQLNRTDMAGSATNAHSVQGLSDVNGDGMLDHWISGCVGCTGRVAIGDGTQFRLPGGSEEMTSMRLGADTNSYNLSQVGAWVFEGVRQDMKRVLDIDNDGRPDSVEWDQFSMPAVTFNRGEAFDASAGTIGAGSALDHRIVASKNRIDSPYAGLDSYAWEIRSDMMDLDGDGIAEGINFGDEFVNTGNMYVSRATVGTHPPRLMASINNHRGLLTIIDYSSMSGPAVTQHPELGKRMPQTQWVVKRITVDDSLSTVEGMTEYHYTSPEFTPDDRGHYAFRGFDEVTTTAPSGAMTTERFSYAPDWSGRLASKIVATKPTDIGAGIASIDDYTTGSCESVKATIVTFHTTDVDHRTCKAGMTEAQCRASNYGRRRTTSTITPLASTTTSDTTSMLCAETQTRLHGFSSTDVDRVTDTSYALASDSTTYRLRRTGETQTLDDATPSVFAKSTTEWDPTYRVAEYQNTWFSNPTAACTSTATHCARSRSVYDMATGNVIGRYKPETPTPDANTKLTYDARKLFVEIETNEVGHIRNYVYEYGTGTTLKTTGPNVATCSLTIPVSCPPNTPFAEEHRIRVDGLGRMIERYETFSASGDSYLTLLTERNTYHDTPTTTEPAPYVRHESAIDYTEGTLAVRYREQLTELDGHGRPVRQTLFAHGSAAANQVTSYHYRGDGTLSDVSVPDPTANDTSTVTYTYAFDSLGRPTAIHRPDAVPLAQQSGIVIEYDGLTQTTTEVVGAAGGQPAATRTTNDAFGRLALVEEQAAFGTWAMTNYEHDPADRVSKIVDPEGVTTTLEHDMAGRRTAILRAGKTRRYGYDKNGNLKSETTPCTPAVTCEVNYTSTYDYDDIDRLIRRHPAQRELSAADQQLFGTALEELHYDTGSNTKGLLQSWEIFGPNTSTAVNSGSYGYNAQGQRQATEQVTRAAGYNQLQRTFYRNYWISGEVAGTFYRDVVGTQHCQNGTYSQTSYDNRGQLMAVQVVPCVYEAGPYSWLLNTRNVAGLVTKRETVAGSGSINVTAARTAS